MHSELGARDRSVLRMFLPGRGRGRGLELVGNLRPPMAIRVSGGRNYSPAALYRGTVFTEYTMGRMMAAVADDFGRHRSRALPS